MNGSWFIAHRHRSGYPMHVLHHHHTYISHGTHMNALWHTYECVMAHIRMSHGTHMNETWHTYDPDFARRRALRVVSCCGVATISRLLKMIGLFCRILSLLWVSFAKETYHFKEPTNRSHPMSLNPISIQFVSVSASASVSMSMSMSEYVSVSVCLCVCV